MRWPKPAPKAVGCCWSPGGFSANASPDRAKATPRSTIAAAPATNTTNAPQRQDGLLSDRKAGNEAVADRLRKPSSPVTAPESNVRILLSVLERRRGADVVLLCVVPVVPKNRPDHRRPITIDRRLRSRFCGPRKPAREQHRRPVPASPRPARLSRGRNRSVAVGPSPLPHRSTLWKAASRVPAKYRDQRPVRRRRD